MKYQINEDIKWLKELWENMEQKFCEECKRLGDKIPYVPVEGRYSDMGETIQWWTNGFWSGILWYLYHVTGNNCYRESAERVEKRLDGALYCYDKLDHDLGMMWLPASVAGYRETGGEESRNRGLMAAALLSSRYNSKGEYIRAWNGTGNEGVIIIDCLMNLPLLYWASEETKDPRFRMAAEGHTRTVAKYLVREDGSCNHIVRLNPYNGEFIEAQGGQGYEEGSAWSRGQAWGLYGMALAYRYIKDEAYLNKAKQIAHYFISQISFTDYVSVIDFRAPKEPVYYDTTASAIAASGLLELSEHVKESEKDFYIKAAISILKGLKSKYINMDINEDGILTHGSGKYHRESDREVPIIYGDFFLLEAVLRLLGKIHIIW